MKVLRRIVSGLRIFGYFLLLPGIWCIWSLGPLLSGNHASFQASGSIIVVWAIIFIGRHRLQYEDALQNANDAALIAALNRLEKHREINEERLDLTFNLHLLQISQLSRHVGAPNPIGPVTDQEIEGLARKIETERSKHGDSYVVAEDTDLRIALERKHRVSSEIGPWQRRVFINELAFLSLGTLQWGYGDKWSEAIHPYVQSSTISSYF